MNKNADNPIERLIDKTSLWIVFLLGLWLVVIRPFGPNWSLVPGDMWDGRFNNYVLEHFFRWVSGLDADFLNGHIFFPFQHTVAFSDNLSGAGLVYAFFRAVGLDKETAFQGWYLVGFCANYLAATYVLRKLNFRPLAAALGAFFFTFGLPILAQETHAQLNYRFGVPLAAFFLWKFFHEPKLTSLAAIFFWGTWQVFLSIYLGFFLALFLLVSALLLPVLAPSLSLWQRLTCWPEKFKTAWVAASPRARLLTLGAIAVLGLSFIILMKPYYEVTQEYGFRRTWIHVIEMLPQPASFLLADGSQIWGPLLGSKISLPARNEHSLFPGLTVLILLLVGVIFRFASEKKFLAWLNFFSVAALTALALNVNGNALYFYVFNLPGINSLRGVTRIHLVLMWPLAVFITWVMDELLARLKARPGVKMIVFIVIAGLLLAESSLFTHSVYSKAQAQQRMLTLSARLPAVLPAEPVLAVKLNDHEHELLTELDAMLLAQERGWSTMNGYSSSIPFHFESIISCRDIPARIKKYMKFKNISDPKTFYLAAMQRIVPIGFSDCDLSWWSKMR